MIIIHEYTLSIVDHVGFRNYSFSLQPLFKCPSRNTIRSDVFKVYDNEKCKIMGVFSKLNSRVAMTTDMWTASNQKRGFMAITGHYIDSEWNLRSNLLRFMYVPHPHIASVLTSTLIDFLLDWNIDGKL
uniref:Transposase n=1 Tax=Kalanchoe fedtschenkoi TaxID=63787 RepID=A0A7N0TFP9_KALFE